MLVQIHKKSQQFLQGYLLLEVQSLVFECEEEETDYSTRLLPFKLVKLVRSKDLEDKVVFGGYQG